jgi:hypothetical protein
VVLDEAQDLSPMECRAVGRRCATGSATVLGDLAQGTTPWATATWADLLGHLGKPSAELRVLRTGYRVPRQILDYASRLLSQIAPGLWPASSLREDPGALEIVAVPADRLAERLAAACAGATAQPGSVAVIAADQQVPELSQALGGLPHAVLAGSGEAVAGQAVAGQPDADARCPGCSARPGWRTGCWMGCIQIRATAGCWWSRSRWPRAWSSIT